MPAKQQWRFPPQKRLKLYLVEHDIQQKWLSAQTGISPVTLGGIMTGRVRPTPYTRGLIAQALGQPPGWLFTDIEDPTDDERDDAERAERRMKPQLDDETVEQLRRLLFGSTKTTNT